MQRTNAFNGVGGGEEKQIDSTEHRELIRHAATEGTVLIKNDGVLPLNPDAFETLALIGPNADRENHGWRIRWCKTIRNVSPLRR